jgi:secondary thiamine-phosphate synthase enzyme
VETEVSRLSLIARVPPDQIATATLVIETAGEGFIEFTGDAKQFIAEARAGDGMLVIFLRHTSASLTIQENADPDVQTDLMTALERLAPTDAGWIHDSEGPDDMPSHLKALLTGSSLQIPVVGGALMLGTWQGIYLVEHRSRPHRREMILQFCGRKG